MEVFDAQWPRPRVPPSASLRLGIGSAKSPVEFRHVGALFAPRLSKVAASHRRDWPSARPHACSLLRPIAAVFDSGLCLLKDPYIVHRHELGKGGGGVGVARPLSTNGHIQDKKEGVVERVRLAARDP